MSFGEEDAPGFAIVASLGRLIAPTRGAHRMRFSGIPTGCDLSGTALETRERFLLPEPARFQGNADVPPTPEAGLRLLRR